MARKKPFQWIRHYGTVTVLGLGVFGTLFFWAVATQVRAQTSDLRADNAALQVRLQEMQANQDAMQATQQQILQLLRKAEMDKAAAAPPHASAAEQRNLAQLTAAIVAALRQLKDEEGDAD